LAIVSVGTDVVEVGKGRETLFQNIIIATISSMSLENQILKKN